MYSLKSKEQFQLLFSLVVWIIIATLGISDLGVSSTYDLCSSFFFYTLSHCYFGSPSELHTEQKSTLLSLFLALVDYLNWATMIFCQ